MNEVEVSLAGHWIDVRNFCCMYLSYSCATRKLLHSYGITWDYEGRLPNVNSCCRHPVDSLPEAENGNSYILVVGDYFIRWMEAYVI